jgi:hypothetical protein
MNWFGSIVIVRFA